MPRPATGQVVERRTSAATVYALRFRAYGKRRFVTLGGPPQWDRRRAEDELANVLADVRRGVWRPVDTTPAVAPVEDPTFHVFASAWFAGRADEWRPQTRLTYRGLLSNHLLPFFYGHQLRH